ncbi:MAG: nickel-dependent lactate racemase [Candidatus Hydrogenedentes bacterium]|nr:nickel-dependent lactate racemase [Candidatus Hydrogenedentota bacterium]
MKITVPYGDGVLSAALPAGFEVSTLDVAAAPALLDPAAQLQTGLREPIGLPSPPLDAVRPGDTVTIVVSDSFRRTGIEVILPALLEALAARGVLDGDIRFLVSTGTHRGPTAEELEEILGAAVFARFSGQSLAHDPHDRANLRHLGVTRRGTPIWINRHALECGHLIVTGTTVLHYFGGFGGGRKSIVPGIAGVETIAHNHALNLHATEDVLNPDVRIGALDGNPVAEDMLEASRPVPVRCLINTVLNGTGEIAGLFVGELEAAHRAAADFAAALFVAPIDERRDFVVASAGSAKNFIQSHKSLFNAYQAIRPGGVIVLLAEAREGYGGNKIAQWLSLGTPARVIAALREKAEINGQTALSTLEKARQTLFITGLSEAEVVLLGGVKAESLEAALGMLPERLGPAGPCGYRGYVMPHASYTVPQWEKGALWAPRT